MLDFYNNWQKSLGKKLSESLAPRISIPRTLMGPTFKPFGGFNPAHSSLAGLARILTTQGRQWQKIFESIGRISSRVYPENWEGVSPRPSLAELEGFLVDEGIPLMWIPQPAAVQAILRADTASVRRRVIGRRWRGIVTDCEEVLRNIDHDALLEERDFALSCVNALRDGHARPAQALAANLLDTALCHLDNDLRRELTNNKFKQNGVRINLDDYTIRAALTFAPVWSAHAQFWIDKGDAVPRVFGRHPSVHAVSRQQYTRINAVIALMVVTSVLKFFDVELVR